MSMWYALHPRGGKCSEDEFLGNGRVFLLSPSLNPSPLLSFSQEICVNTASRSGPAGTAQKLIRNHMEIAAVPSAVTVLTLLVLRQRGDQRADL